MHGVTSVISGNCGFTLAPLRPDDADYTRRMMAKVEGMPLAALEQGVDWKWHTFGEFLDRLDSKIAVNAGFLVGHCAIRRYVMGADSVGNEATPEQIAAMAEVLGESIEAGGLGFSTTLSRTHSDGDGQPVPSRWSTPEELVALCRVVEQHAGTTLEGMTDGCLDRFDEDEIELFIAMSAAARRPDQLERAHRRLPRGRPRSPTSSAAGDRAAEAGARIVALTMPVLVPMNMSFLNHCGLFLIPGWSDVLGLPVPERIAELREPETQQRMLAQSAAPEAGVFKRLADFANYIIGDTYSAENEGLKGRKVADIAAEAGHGAVRDADRHRAWPTSSARSSGPSRPTATTRRGSCASRCGTTPGPCSAAPTPAPTSTACAARPTPPASSATRCAAASSCRSNGRCSSSPTRRRGCSG